MRNGPPLTERDQAQFARIAHELAGSGRERHACALLAGRGPRRRVPVTAQLCSLRAAAPMWHS